MFTQTNHLCPWYLIVMHTSSCLWVFHGFCLEKCLKEGTGRQLYTVSHKCVFLLSFVAHPKRHMLYIMPWSMNRIFLNTVHLCPQPYTAVGLWLLHEIILCSAAKGLSKSNVFLLELLINVCQVTQQKLRPDVCLKLENYDACQWHPHTLGASQSV